MKTLLVIAALGLLVYMGYQKSQRPPVKSAAEIAKSVYGEMRVNTVIENREIEMALFVRVPNKEECLARARKEWEDVLQACPGCNLKPVKCTDSLAPRYARLFDDVAIPSTYLSLTAGTATERDGRLVVYGLTDQEGVLVCEQMRKIIGKKYSGSMHCVAPSGG